jgi:dihydroorotate dehydrogenase (fumarate)
MAGYPGVAIFGDHSEVMAARGTGWAMLIRRMEDAGAAAVVLHSLFEEQIEFENHALNHYADSSADSSYWEATSYYPEPSEFTLPPDEYLEHVRHAKDAVGIPIIASLNGVTSCGWLKCARLIEQAGADALELNVYVVPIDPRLAGERLDESTLDIVRQVRQSLDRLSVQALMGRPVEGPICAD